MYIKHNSLNYFFLLVCFERRKQYHIKSFSFSKAEIVLSNSINIGHYGCSWSKHHNWHCLKAKNRKGRIKKPRNRSSESCVLLWLAMEKSMEKSMLILFFCLYHSIAFIQLLWVATLVTFWILLVVYNNVSVGSKSMFQILRLENVKITTQTACGRKWFEELWQNNFAFQGNVRMIQLHVIMVDNDAICRT